MSSRQRWIAAFLLCLAASMSMAAADESDCSLSSLTDGIQKGLVVKKSADPRANYAMYVERKILLQEFFLHPAFYFMTGSASTSACAFPDSDPDAGIVGFGEDLLKAEVAQAGGPEYASSIAAIMAHEFAHLLQIKNGDVSSGAKHELQADYIAGWYMGRRAKFVPNSASQQSLQNIMRSFYAKGDYAMNDPSHHGTPDERVAAISAGFDHSNLRLPDAYAASLAFVSSAGSPRRADYDPLELADALRNIMKHQASGFADLRGPLDEDSKSTWIATTRLPSATRCVVEWRNKYQGSYSCVMAANLDQASAEGKWKQLVNDVHDRFASHWKTDDSQSSLSKRVVFTSPESDDVSLSVSIAKGTRWTGYDIEIEIPFDNY